jgi:hypothetical protein
VLVKPELAGVRVSVACRENERERERKKIGLLSLSTAAAIDFIDSEGGGTHLGAAKPPESATEELPRSGGGR